MSLGTYSSLELASYLHDLAIELRDKGMTSQAIVRKVAEACRERQHEVPQFRKRSIEPETEDNNKDDNKDGVWRD